MNNCQRNYIWTVSLFSLSAVLHICIVLVDMSAIQKKPLYALNEPHVKCGTVPIYLGPNGRSINETYPVEKLGDDGELDKDDGEFRILHGLDAKSGEWPWIAYIDVCDSPSDEKCAAHCTGSLLNSRWILTAGHCCHQRIAGQLRVRLGLYDLVNPDKDLIRMRVDRITTHPEYTEDNENDICVLRVEKPVPFGEKLQPVCLLPPVRSINAYTRHKKCYTIGYGLGEMAEEVVKLQKLQITARTPEECNTDASGDLSLLRFTVCIGPPVNKQGATCNGDSGGPDVCYDSLRDQWTLFGSTSYGPSSCDRDDGDHWLAVSMDLANYRRWLIDNTKDLS